MRTLFVIITMFFVFQFSNTVLKASEEKFEILTTTFPIYQITRNITKGRKGAKVHLLLPPQLGCPHEYSLTPNDMSRLAKASLLIMNGLGLEEFLEGALKKANPDLKIIDTSKGIKNRLHYTCTHSGHDHAHQHDVNPHLFVSPVFSAKIAENIALGLSESDPGRAELYKKNAKEYGKKMEKLSADFARLGRKLENNRIVQPHGVFDYLARDMGLKIVATLLAEGQEPSASGMIKLVKIIKKEKVGAILTEPQYPDKIEKTLSRETGVPVIQIDPTASGPLDAPLDYYEKAMRKNLETLKKTLGKEGN